MEEVELDRISVPLRLRIADDALADVVVAVYVGSIIISSGSEL